jgi:APA family basic amino acid/polyamine antiporter
VSSAPEAPPEKHGQRVLGFWMSTALVVGNIIGVGIFTMPASLAPYGLNALTGWAVNVVGCLCLALAFSGLARAFPRDDGPVAYITRAFGRGPAFVVMWCYWVSIWVANAGIAIGLVGYAAVFLPSLTRTAGVPAITALLMIWAFVLVNLLGTRTAGWVQMLTTLLKLVPQFAVIVLGAWLLVTHPAVYAAHVPPNPPSWHEVSAVSTLALFAMLGIECAMVPAARVRDPERNIPRATIAGTLLTALIYISISAVPLFLIPQAELAASNAPYSDLFSRVLGGQYGAALAAFVLISGLGVLNGWTLLGGEAVQCMARHGVLPPSLSRENGRGAPARALLLTGVLAAAALLINYTDSIAKAFEMLIVIATAATLPLYFGSTLAFLVLRRRRELPGRIARAPLPLVASAGAALYCAWASLGIGAQPLLWTLVLGGAGVPIYLWSLYVQRRAAPLGSAAL